MHTRVTHFPPAQLEETAFRGVASRSGEARFSSYTP
jgi:hypothetical protein